MAPEAQPGKQPSPALLFDTFNAYQRTQSLKTGIELGVFTIIAEGNTTAKTIADKMRRVRTRHSHPLRLSRHQRFPDESRKHLWTNARLGDVPRQAFARIHGDRK